MESPRHTPAMDTWVIDKNTKLNTCLWFSSSCYTRIFWKYYLPWLKLDPLVSHLDKPLQFNFLEFILQWWREWEMLLWPFFKTVYKSSNLSSSPVLAACLFSCVGLDWGHVLTTVPPVLADSNWPVGGFNRKPKKGTYSCCFQRESFTWLRLMCSC